MHLAIERQVSCARTWLSASSSLNGLPDRAYHNILMSVEDPCHCDEADRQIIDGLNAHLARYDKYLTTTVANTIFPEALYRAHGAPKFYDVYLREVCSRQSKRGWGRYFERMISHATNKNLNPLQSLIEKLKREAARKGGVCNAYELSVGEGELDLSIYDPVRDAKAIIGGQCLSFLSFHIGPDRRLLLTAVYRNHFYIARLLGNLIGLGRLLRFVAEQADLPVGELTVLSTHAEIDTVGTRGEIEYLLASCHEVLRRQIDQSSEPRLSVGSTL